MTSITPFGQDGPYSQYLGEEIVNYAMGMIMSISGVQGEEPLKLIIMPHSGCLAVPVQLQSFSAQRGGLRTAPHTVEKFLLENYCRKIIVGNCPAEDECPQACLKA